MLRSNYYSVIKIILLAPLFLLFNKLDAQIVLDQDISKYYNEPTKKFTGTTWGFDFHFISISAHYSSRIGAQVYIGGELGILPDKADWILLADRYFTQKNTIWSNDRSDIATNSSNQLFFVHFFTRWVSASEQFEIDTGFRFAQYDRHMPYSNDFHFSKFRGLYLKPLYKIDRFGIGIRIDFGFMNGNSYGDFSEFVIIASPAIRFNLD